MVRKVQGSRFGPVRLKGYKKRGRPTIYKWDEWFASPEVTLTKGKDFHCQVHGLVQQFRTQGSKRGVRVYISIHNDTVHVKFTHE